MYAGDAWSSEAVIFMLLSVPFYSLKRDILKLLKPFPAAVSLNIYQHAGIDGRRLLADGLLKSF